MILELHNIYKTYIQGKMEVPVLKDISLSVDEGEYVAIMGPSGSGKTTLMNLLSALDYPKSGEILFEGKPIQDLPEHDREQMRKTQIGFVFQSVALIPMMTAYENVEFVLRLAGYKGDRRKRTEECLKLVGLGSRMHHMPQELSGGEQQMLAISRGLMSNPKLLMLDEPSLGLAPIIVEEIFNMIEKVRKAGTTVLLIEQNASIALQISDYAYAIELGRISLSGTGQELLNSEDVKRVYLGM